MKSKWLSIFMVLAILLSMWIALPATPTNAAGGSATFTTAGTTSWTAPVGVSEVSVEVWGGGGRGANLSGCLFCERAGGGGGGGAYSKDNSIPVIPGTTYTVVVGAGSSSTAAGGDSYFISTSTVLAKGGNSAGNDSSTGASGGAAASGVGDTKYSGGAGASGSTDSNYGGGGGSSAGTGSNGTTATNQNGAIAPTGGGNGGNGRSGGSGDGSAGTAPGGAGGGAYTYLEFLNGRTGGSGATGKVVISWTWRTFTSVSTGNWSNAATWSPSEVPDTTDAVVIANGTTVTMNGNYTINRSVTVNSGGTLNLGTNTLSGAGAFTLASGATLGIGSPQGITSSGASGNIQMTGTRSFSTGANYVYNGSAAQVTGNGLPATVNNLTVNNSAGVSLSQAVTVNSTLTLTSGRLTLGGYDLTMGSGAGAVDGTLNASNMIVADGAGALCKQYTSTISYTYPIGDVTGTAEYSPATLSFTSLANPSNYQACVRVTDAVHPNNYEPNYLTRYWTVTTSGSADSLSCDVNFTYVDADYGALTEANLVGAKWDGSTWTLLGSVNAGSNAVVGTVSSFSDFTAGYGPTAVTVAPPQASGQGQAIVVSWQAASEVGIVRYRLYRSIGLDGERSLVYETPANTGQMEEAYYEYTDTGVTQGVVYTYWLEVETLGGETEWLPPATALVGGYSIFLPAVHR